MWNSHRTCPHESRPMTCNRGAYQLMKEQATSPGSGGSKPAEPTEQERSFGTKTRNESLKVGLHTQRLQSPNHHRTAQVFGGAAAGVLPLFSFPGFPPPTDLRFEAAWALRLGFSAVSVLVRLLVLEVHLTIMCFDSKSHYGDLESKHIMVRGNSNPGRRTSTDSAMKPKTTASKAASNRR